MFGKWRNDPMKSKRWPGRSISGVNRARSTPLGITATLGCCSSARSCSDMTTTFRYSLNPFLLESLPAPMIPTLGDAGRAVANLAVQLKRDVVFHQHVAAVGREHGVFHLHRLDLVFGADASQRGGHRGRTKFVDFRGRERGPARFAIARLIDQDHARAKFQDGLEVVCGFRVAKGEQKNVELGRTFRAAD